MKISDLQPTNVFSFFELISSVPHGSGNTAKICDLCCNFARERGLDYIQDDIGNVIIFKPGTKGYENHEPVILQGHMDMVTVKTPDSQKNLLTDGLDLVTDGEYLWADKTSLGADDGIALAMAMAVLDSKDIPHPPIEAVFTINEETGMDGANFIDTSVLRGRRMLNIDSEEEGIITVGCAGGARISQGFSFERESISAVVLEVTIDGLTGGHSGNEIHKGRANALVQMGKLLSCIFDESEDCRLISVSGGEADNAIARMATAQIAVRDYNPKKVNKILGEFKLRCIERYKETDPNICISVNCLGNKTIDTIPCDIGTSIINALAENSDGVIKMSEEINGLVQTSINLGTVVTTNDEMIITRCLRSSVNAEKDAVINEFKKNAKFCEVRVSGRYPAWEYIPESGLRSTAEAAFEALYGKAPIVTVIHAGLECGLFSSKINGLDCISFGPDIPDIHTANEKLSIASTDRTYRFLLEILKNL